MSHRDWWTGPYAVRDPDLVEGETEVRTILQWMRTLREEKTVTEGFLPTRSEVRRDQLRRVQEEQEPKSHGPRGTLRGFPGRWESG